MAEIRLGGQATDAVRPGRGVMREENYCLRRREIPAHGKRWRLILAGYVIVPSLYGVDDGRTVGNREKAIYGWQYTGGYRKGDMGCKSVTEYSKLCSFVLAYLQSG